MTTLYKRPLLHLAQALPPALPVLPAPVSLPAQTEPFVERDDDPAQAEELERQQDA